jgi:hypothetical protein
LKGIRLKLQPGELLEITAAMLQTVKVLIKSKLIHVKTPWGSKEPDWQDTARWA